jgi:hypothetical protein
MCTALRNLTCFRYVVRMSPRSISKQYQVAGSHLVHSCSHTCRRRPSLSRPRLMHSNLGLFFPKLTVACGQDETRSYVVHPVMATAITNSSVGGWIVTLIGTLYICHPEVCWSLSDRFMGPSPEHLRIQVTLPYLVKLSSFKYEARNEDIPLSRGFWN